MININDNTKNQLSYEKWVPQVMMRLFYEQIEEAAKEIYNVEKHILTYDQCKEIIEEYLKSKSWNFLTPTPEILIIEDYRMN